MEEEQIISNPSEFSAIVQAFKKGGADNIHILADFDKTITRAFVNGKPFPSMIAVLREDNYLTPDYPAKANALFDKYHPMENDPKMTLEERKAAMDLWWKEHFELLIASGLNKKDIEKAINSGRAELREGARDLFSNLREKGIPVVIISAAGLGADSISMFFEREGIPLDNIDIVCNQYDWDEEGNAVGYKKPVIHVLNKDESVLDEFPFYGEIKKRPNVILLGDNVADVGMSKGSELQNLLKIGFLNQSVEQSMPSYKQAFDLVIPNDGSFKPLNQLIKEIVG